MARKTPASNAPVLREQTRNRPIATAEGLIADLPEDAQLLADKGYDADALREAVRNRKAWANVPP